MDLFTPVVDVDKQHDIFKLLTNPALHAERKVITDWATGFTDRDNKFVKEFQTTFESSFLELYLHKILKEDNVDLDFSHHADPSQNNGQYFPLKIT